MFDSSFIKMEDECEPYLHVRDIIHKMLEEIAKEKESYLRFLMNFNNKFIYNR